MANPITKQELFNKVWERAKIQKKSVSSGGNCHYRNPDGSGNHCFIGIAIPDENYNHHMEGLSAHALSPRLFPNICDALFLNQLQFIHDTISCYLWQQELTNFATQHELTIPQPAV